MKTKNIILLLFLTAIIITGCSNITGSAVYNPNTPEGAMNICIKTTTEKAIELIGEQGGKIYLEDYIDTGTIKIHKSYIQGENNMPTTQEIQEEIKTYIEEEMKNCKGIDKPEITVKIKEKEVETKIKFQKKEFAHTTPVRLGKIIETADEIVKFTIENPAKINREVTKYGFNVEVIQFKENILYKLTDTKSKINDEEYRYFVGFEYE